MFDKSLDEWAKYLGTKRKWLGLEPDFIFRKRLYKLRNKGFTEKPPTHFNCRCSVIKVLSKDI